jgi:NAD(P)-dependent dehydrogenase (short-subunit alcohol dehydrogenase family)
MAKKKNPPMSGVPDPGFTWARGSADALQLAGRRVAVVGGTDGLGRAIARVLARRGAEVTVVGRTFRDEGVANVSFVRADLSSMKEARRVARELPAERFDLVLFTTGILAAPTRETTREGIERDMAVSYLSRLAMLRELAPRLGSVRAEGATKPRVFVMGFPGTGQLGEPVDDLNAERSYDAMKVHMNTVAGNEMLVLDGARRYPALGVFGLSPGLIRTNIRANYLGEGSLKHRLTEWMIGLFTTSPEVYAERIAPLLFAPELDGRTGLHFNQKGIAILPTEALTPSHVERFLAASDALVEKALAASA